jgi:hypothetical protein
MIYAIVEGNFIIQSRKSICNLLLFFKPWQRELQILQNVHLGTLAARRSNHRLDGCIFEIWIM